jgi:uncharacterized membrane protein
MSNKKYILITSSMVFSLAIISILLGIFSSLSILESFRTIFGSVYVLFLPGFLISYIFFPKTKPFEDEKSKHGEKNKNSGAIGWLERIALSFALSIAIVPLAVFCLNLIGVKINFLNSSLIIFAIILVSSLIICIRKEH